MIGSTKIACVILSAGMSKRFGGTKQLAKMKGGITLIQNALNVANQSDSDYVFLILGHSASRILEGTSVGRAQVVLNKEFRKGLSSSLKSAISNLPPDCSGALFMVADQPFVNTKILNDMIEAFRAHSESRIVALAFNGSPRNPVLISKGVFPELLSLEGDVGAREIVRRHSKEALLINIKESRIFFDIDTRADLEIGMNN